MASTTRPDFNSDTEALEVAKQFPEGTKGKTALVTGVNRDGLGFSTAQALASGSPARLILAGRNASKVQICIDALKSEYPNVDYRFLHIDLFSQKSVRAAAETVMSWADVPTIDLVVNSAGVMGVQQRTLSEEGIEMHFATNHIGHWLLTCRIMPKLIAAAQGQPKGAVRIVNVSSASPMVSGMRWSDMAFDVKNKDLPEAEQLDWKWFAMWGFKDLEETAYNPLDGYNRSKVANVLFSIGANRRLSEKYGILSIALHPGVIWTELGRNFNPDTRARILEMLEAKVWDQKSLGSGSATSLVAALDPALAEGVGQSKGSSENWGVYLDACQITDKAHPLAVSSTEAEKLWEVSEKMTGEKFAW